MNIQIATQKMKISSTSKTLDMSDRSEIDPDGILLRLIAWFINQNMFIFKDISEKEPALWSLMVSTGILNDLKPTRSSSYRHTSDCQTNLTSLTVVFIPLSALGHFLLGSKPQMLVNHLLILVILFIIISLSARHYGERFVANAIVETSIK
jgi:hypothetical protein